MKKELFGQLQGQDIFKYTLQNDRLSLSILNYGGIIQHLMCPDKYGQKNNIVLSYDDFESYVSNPFYFGCMLGRCAGRTESFTLNNEEYILKKNSDTHHIHGGDEGFHKQIWDAETFNDDTLVLSYYSPHLEGGYPGNIKIDVTYRIKDNAIHTRIKAFSDQETVINIGNYNYFNLSGHSLLGTEQVLKINSDYIIETGENQLPTGKILSVQDTPFDFRKGKKINADMHKIKDSSGYDHTFLINGGPIVLQDEISRRELSIETNQPSCAVYTGNHLTDASISKGLKCRKHLGVCLSTQAPQNSVNIPVYKNLVTLKAKQNYIQENTWTFSVY